MIKYEETDKFKKDLKKLLKRFRSLNEDLETVKKAVIELRHLKNIDNLATFEIPGFNSEMNTFWKIRKFACKSLKGSGVKSGIRVIYCWQERGKVILFLEIYFKGDKENEDRSRIIELI
jgi:mRNA-degrading endonuclease RelE of RelBE toxin-antitoxin system